MLGHTAGDASLKVPQRSNRRIIIWKFRGNSKAEDEKSLHHYLNGAKKKRTSLAIYCSSYLCFWIISSGWFLANDNALRIISLFVVSSKHCRSHKNGAEDESKWGKQSPAAVRAKGRFFKYVKSVSKIATVFFPGCSFRECTFIKVQPELEHISDRIKPVAHPSLKQTVLHSPDVNRYLALIRAVFP